MSKLYQKVKKARQESEDSEFRWLMGMPAIVADNEDPDKQHRVRVIIPSIDEDKVYGWARQLVFCMGNGFGSFFLPPVGSEVVLFGQMGQKFNLFYASVYNETHEIPPDFADETAAGIRAPADLKLIAETDMQFRGGRLRIESDTSVEIIAPAGLIVDGKRIG